NVALNDEPQEIAKNLWAQEVDPLVRLERWWPDIEPLLGASIGGEIVGTALEELTLGPGLADVIRLLALKERCDTDEYDVIVVDAGSSLSALQLLSYPEGAAWWIGRLLAPSKDEPNPLAEHVDSLAQGLADLRSVLGDGAQCSVRIVTTAEQLS